MFGAIGKALGGVTEAVGSVVENLDLDFETVVGLGMGIATQNWAQVGYYAVDVLDGKDDAIVGQFEQIMPFASLAMGNPAGASGLLGGDAGALTSLLGQDGGGFASLLGSFAGEGDAVGGFDLFSQLLGSLNETETSFLSQLLVA